MQNIGYDTHNSIITLGSVGLLAFGSLSMMFFYLIAIMPLQYFVGKRYRRLRKTLFFGQIIQVTHGAYFEVLIAGYLNIRYPVDTLSGETAAYVVARGYWVIALGILPLLWGYTLTKSVRHINTRRFQSRFGALFEDIKTKSKSTMVYYLIFCLRRICFCLLAFGLADHSSNQVQAVMLLNLAIIIFQGLNDPFITRKKNRIEMFNEVSIAIATGHDMFFTDIIPTRHGHFLVGWSMISVMLFNAAVNIGIALWILIRHVFLLYLWVYYRLRRLCDPEFMRQPPIAIQLVEAVQEKGGPPTTAAD